MELLDRLDNIQSIFNRLDESGIRNIKDLSKDYKEAEIYFHQDLDGVTSAIGIKKYLENFGIKITNAHMINYGAQEYSVPKPKKGKLNVMVDFAHGKPQMNIHTDHHDAQVGYAKTASTNFVKTPSNLAYISQTLSPRDIFPPEDTKIISTVDSADFARYGLTPDDIMRAAFSTDKSVDVSKNKQMMGLVVNKLVLTYKNKKGFLDELVLTSRPSLVNMYNNIKTIAKKNGYKPPEQIEKDTKAYQGQQKSKIQQGTVNDVPKLTNGQSILVGRLITQYGGGYMSKGGYDRYTPFKLHPEAHYYSVAWPMGLMQLSKNPFMKGTNPHDLGKIMMKVLNKYKSKLSKDVTLDFIKYTFEKDSKKGSMGFTFNDLIALFEKNVRGLKGSKFWREMVEDITNKPYSYLSKKQKDVLKNIKINLWDLIMSQSGGHHDITNISGMNFYGKGYTDLMHAIQKDIAIEMRDKRLKE